MNNDDDLQQSRDHTPAPAAEPAAMTRPDGPGVLLGDPLPGQEYPATLRTQTARWWKPLVGILAGVLVLLVGSGLLSVGALMIDAFVFDVPFGTMTPFVYASMLLALILLIPTTLLLVRYLHGQRIGFNSSVTGRLRWGYVLRVTPPFLVLFSVYMAVFTILGPEGGDPSDNWWMFALLSVLLMPFQAAAEEIFFRGYVQRAAGSWFRTENVAFVVGTLISAVLFMAAHFAADLWLNLYYFCFGVLLSLSVRLTGGLEVAIVLHVVNNVAAGVVGAYTQDMESAFDRSAGVGGPFMLIQIVVIAVCVAGLVAFARRSGLQERVAA
ncbi:MAG: CPBP family intramembrane metalloprotease [Mobilicoccus sp.]|nr:CPBP family intramembrane metalloprotease [Mobilicoccus sp.]